MVGHRAAAASPGVEALAGLAAEVSGRHLVAQTGWWVEALPYFPGEVFGDSEAYVEPDHVGCPQGSHGVLLAQRHGGVDVLGAGDSLLQVRGASSAIATPRRLLAKPGESVTVMAVLPSADTHSGAAITSSGEVLWPRTISTSSLAGTGLKKCSPTSGLPGYDLVAQARSGLMSVTGAKGGRDRPGRSQTWRSK